MSSGPETSLPEAAADSDEDFQFEEVSHDEDVTLTDEEEEDLEATVRKIQNRTESGVAPSASSRTDHFLRTFLAQMGMTQTLDCFQAEWSEMTHRGLVDAQRVGVVPYAYVECQRAENALRRARRELEEYREVSRGAARILDRARRSRDFHRRQHERVAQERTRLIRQIEKVKGQCAAHETAGFKADT